MSKQTRTIVKNLVIAATISLAAFASWAFTDFRVPQIEVAVNQSQES